MTWSRARSPAHNALRISRTISGNVTTSSTRTLDTDHRLHVDRGRYTGSFGCVRHRSSSSFTSHSVHPAYAQAMNAVGTEPVESKGGVQLETQLENELGHVIRWIGQSVEVTQLVESEEVSLPLLGT